MSSFEIEVSSTFCAGHRIKDHESKCRNLHGHNYTVQATVVPLAAQLDQLGRVIDFSDAKRLLGSWIDHNWDHGFIVWQDDFEARDILERVVDQKLYLLPYNPTAENLARFLVDVVCPEIFRGKGVAAVKIKVQESSTSSASCHASRRTPCTG